MLTQQQFGVCEVGATVGHLHLRCCVQLVHEALSVLALRQVDHRHGHLGEHLQMVDIVVEWGIDHCGEEEYHYRGLVAEHAAHLGGEHVPRVFYVVHDTLQHAVPLSYWRLNMALPMMASTPKASSLAVCGQSTSIPLPKKTMSRIARK